MNRPKYDKLQAGDKVRLREGYWENEFAGREGIVVQVAKNRMGQVKWIDVKVDEGDPFRIESGYISIIESV